MARTATVPIDAVFLTLTGVRRDARGLAGYPVTAAGELAPRRSHAALAALLAGVNSVLKPANVTLRLASVKNGTFAMPNGEAVVSKTVGEDIIQAYRNGHGMSLVMVPLIAAPDAGYTFDDFRVSVVCDMADTALVAHEFGHEFGLDHEGGARNLMWPSFPPGSKFDLSPTQAAAIYASKNARMFGAAP